jgi:OmpA-OmpF porin, OOP family
MYKHRARIGVLLLAVLASAGAQAADDGKGGYVGIAAGEAQTEIDFFIDENDTVYKIFGGWSFNRYIAAEVGYFDGGNPTATIGTQRREVESDGFYAAAIGSLPIGDRISLFARLGYAFYDVTLSAQAPGIDLSESDDDGDLLYGFGAAAHVTDGFDVRLELEAIDVSNAAFEMLTLSAIYRF